MDSSNIPNIPDELKALMIWLVWKREQVDGRVTKVPYNARTGRKASSTDPATWSSLDEAVKAVMRPDAYNGLGIGISGEIAAVDIDNCVDLLGQLTPMAQDIVSAMDQTVDRQGG